MENIQHASASSGPAIDDPDAASVKAAMRVPVTVMLGPMGTLLRKLHWLMAPRQSLAPDLLRAEEVSLLSDGLKKLCISLKNMSEDEDPSFMVQWWMKIVRELCYDTEDHLDEVCRAGTHHDFSDLLARVDDASESRQCFEWSPPKTVKPAERGRTGVSRRTSLELPVPLPVHVEPPNKLVELLDLHDEGKALKVITITGCAGVGKTTAARALYHRYGGKFQCRAFVTVSRNPDMRGFLTSILSQLKAPPPHRFPDVPDLIGAIGKHLQGKRYIIVIDDLWTSSVWNIISRAFPRGDYCSRIITTTQIDDVALACCSYDPVYIYKMFPLNDPESRKLFFGIVFGSEDGCPIDIKEVSYDIVKKCSGLPFAVVNIARLLASESHIVRERWEHIQDSLPSTSEDMIDVLNLLYNILPHLMYNSLPPRLRTCLLYLSMYSEGHVIKKDELVKQWVTEGFLSAVGGRNTQEIAEGYFDELVFRGMVQAVDINNNGEVLSCTVHQMVLDFIRLKSMEENFIINVDFFQSTLALPDKVRRLSIQFGGVKGAYIPESIVTSHVRSLIFWGFFKCIPPIMDYYGFLRVLILHIWADEEKESFDLTGIGKLLLLNYLKIESNTTIKLPDKIQRLQHLETLQVNARLTVVPSDIVSLPRMLCLSLPSDADMPSGIGRMTSLHTLGYFDLSNNPADSVKDLDHLTNLGDLHLTCAKLDNYNLQNNIKLLGSVLWELISLKCLTLAPADSSDINTLADAGASSMGICFDGLRLKLCQEASRPWALQRLELSRHCCTFSRLPEWIGILLNLRILRIAIRELSEEDIHVLKGLRFLTALTLYAQTAPADRIVIKEGFEVLTYFKFMCGAPCLSFVPGAMPKVQKIKLGLNLSKRSSELDSIIEAACFHHLTGLTEISVKFGTRGADEFRIKYEESALEAAFRNAPNSTTIRVKCVDVIFCAEEDKCTATDEQEEKRQAIEQDKENIREHESRYPRTDRVFTALMHHAQSVDLVTGASNTLPLGGERPPTPTVVEHRELDRLEMVGLVSLVGMILPMVQLIASAAETARQNKKKCWELAQRTCTLANVLPYYKYPAANDQEAVTVMRRLKETLDEALTLIQSCQTVTVFSRRRKAAELDGVNRKIDDCITDLNFIRQVRTNHVAAPSAVPLPAQTCCYYQAQGGGGASNSACVGYPRPPQRAPVNVHWTPAPAPYQGSPAPYQGSPAPSASGHNL
ncbi:disease resistance protein RGA5-like [Triticum dicoccoides]|uniref:disease resistance protein RGA5-like n=1 Tax=Triticum dicoccoides TaxID=85692 RepID=UPI00188E133B|nr:disease resistance protein RGA5-like [Triticum dicoccoides]